MAPSGDCSVFGVTSVLCLALHHESELQFVVGADCNNIGYQLASEIDNNLTYIWKKNFLGV